MAPAVLTTPDYHARFANVIREATGIKLSPAKRTLVEGRLRRRVAELGLGKIEDYFRYLFEGGGLDAELPEVIDLITTNKTDFFREPAHFDFLRTEIVPRVARRARPGHPARLRLWSAAASEGAEAYTAAMVLAEEARSRGDIAFAILGTDISRRMVARATRAIYNVEQLEPVPAGLRTRYTMDGHGETAGQARIVPELRCTVRFRHMNLMASSYPIETGIDVAFLRNVLIYFDENDQRRVISGVSAHLASGGYLIVGHSESMIVRHPGLQQIAPGVFRQD